MTAWFLDGRPCDTIAADDRAVQYGDGLFETVAIRDGEPRLWDYHVERLRTGAARLGIEAPAESVLRSGLLGALGRARAARARCLAKIVLTAGTGPRGYARSPSVQTTLLTGISDAAALPASCYRDGVALRICRTRLAMQPQLAGMKTLNRLEQVLARNEWSGDAVFEGLTLDTDDRVICGTMSNVFLISDKGLLTPALTRCGVAGVMRRHILTLLDSAGIDCSVRDIGIDELWSADGVFISNSQFGVLPVRRCGEHAWPLQESFRRLAAMVRASGIVEGPA
jgi:4-amino-4-deoxychorismate lyase